VGLGLHQGLLQQKTIAGRTGSAAMAAPISGEGLDPPAVPPWSSRWTGRPPLRWSRAEAMRSWDQTRSRPPAATMTTERWAWATAAEDKLMGYRANERGKLSEDY
jgi:hypothetical protein